MKRSNLLILFVFAFVLCSLSAHSMTDAGGKFDTSTRRVPGIYDTIQGAINAAENGDTILVSPGTYMENIDFLCKAITLESAEGSSVTVIDGSQHNGVVVRIKTHSGEKAVLHGFTIRNGKRGGIECTSSSPLIKNCLITENVCNLGAGIYCFYTSPEIEGCVITNNGSPSGTERGGGIYCNYSSPIITNCVISQNQAEKGAGIYCLEESSPQIIHSAILDNKGEALYCDSNCHPKLINTISWGNDERPGVVLAGASRITVNHCLLEGGRENFSSREVNCVLHWYGPEESPHPQLRESDILPGLYHLTANSPCIDAGVYVGVTTDIDGETRGLYDSKLDIGPDERIDRDGDGWPARADCDDSNPDVNPDAEEDRGNGIDDDCDGQTDEGCFISVVTFFQ